MNTNLHAFLRSRRSVRHFLPQKIPEEVLLRILETTSYAPSAHNRQPWRLVVLSSLEARWHLAEAISNRLKADMSADGASPTDIQARVERTIRRTNEAPLVIVLCRDVTQVDAQPDASRKQAEAEMGRQSVAAAGLQLLLAAEAEGLSGTWICWPLFAQNDTRQALDLPQEWEPQGMMFLGYPSDQPETPARKPLPEIVRYI
jgi:coenzyme F420-0:L-glutamate ligase/coenzyme F420-1:gamma-L-glutamate ligase